MTQKEGYFRVVLFSKDIDSLENNVNNNLLLSIHHQFEISKNVISKQYDEILGS